MDNQAKKNRGKTPSTKLKEQNKLHQAKKQNYTTLN
jgi:hypothetical protein